MIASSLLITINCKRGGNPEEKTYHMPAKLSAIQTTIIYLGVGIKYFFN